MACWKIVHAPTETTTLFFGRMFPFGWVWGGFALGLKMQRKNSWGWKRPHTQNVHLCKADDAAILGFTCEDVPGHCQELSQCEEP
eukprot:2649493-Amphidinium_carterae.1